MSKRSQMARERIAPTDVTLLDSYEPDYDTPCDNCGETPTVTGVKAGIVVYHSGMCGPCTWGESSLIDPANW